jgi:nitrogen regulatory protein P-II 1
MYMVFCVLDDPEKLGKVLEALEKGGVSGATIMESTGLHRQQKKRIAMPYLYSTPTLNEMDNTTIFTIVPNKKAAEDCLAIVENVVGDINNPNTGIYAAWELDILKGLSPSGYAQD